jgi:restriction system protein
VESYDERFWRVDDQSVAHLPGPVLEALSDGAIHVKRDMQNAAIGAAGLTPEQQLEQLDSGQLRSLNRIGWATSALRRAKALVSPSRGTFAITDTGRELLA